ncbi:MAG: FAD:protein FMN transferase [Candidatus Geothermincolia bacterium]
MKHLKTAVKISIVALLAIGAVVLVVFLASRESGNTEPKGTYHSPTVFAMDTTLDVTIQGRSTAQATQDFEAALALARKIEDETSRFKPASDVSKINAQAGVAPVAVSEDTFNLVKLSIQYGQLTNGAFDITVAPVAQVWGFYDQKYRIPTVEEIREAVSKVGYRKIIIDENNKTVMLQDKGMQIDLGGIAKGYAVGRMYELLKTRGLQHALINFGGAIGALGNRIDGKDWVIGIKDPRAKGGELSGELKVSNAFVSSSGDYERFFIRNGKRYFHIFDPSTGDNPAQVIGTTVVGPDSAVADILSTTLIVMGPARGLEFMTTQQGFEAIVIDNAGKVLFTPNMKSKYVIQVKEHI